MFERMAEHGSNVLATRADAAKFEAVKARVSQTKFHELSGCITVRRSREKRGHGLIAVICAGTSDLPVAEEAAVTADLMGNIGHQSGVTHQGFARNPPRWSLIWMEFHLC